jgi:hypothetical protein
LAAERALPVGLIAQATAILDGRCRLETSVLSTSVESPQAVAYGRRGDCGAVMFLKESRAGEWICLLIILVCNRRSWEELSVVHKPWWNPQEPFAENELFAIGGHSRFSSDVCPEVVVIPGQAAPQTRVRRLDAVPAEPVITGPWGHFVYVGCLDEPGAPVSLEAERAGERETIKVKMFDPP